MKDLTTAILTDNIVASAVIANPINIVPVDLECFELTTLAMKNMYSATKTDALPFILKHMDTYEINTKTRMAAFLSACFIMSCGFRRKVEHYKFTADRLFKECHKVDSIALARRLIRNGEEEIANYLFSFESGNGGIDSGDGWNYRARSALQFRGRELYTLVRDTSGIDCVNNPALLEDEENAIVASMVYWQTEGYNQLADKLKFTPEFELQTSINKNGAKNYRSNAVALKMKKKLSGDTTMLLDFCEFIENGMKYL